MFSFAAPPHKSVEPIENWRFFAGLSGTESGFFAGFAEKQGCFRVKRPFIPSLRETPRIACAERADWAPIEYPPVEHPLLNIKVPEDHDGGCAAFQHLHDRVD